MRPIILAIGIALAVGVAVAVAASQGALTQLSGTAGCISETGDGGGCADGRGLKSPFDIKVTPDGKFAYAVSYISDGVAAFSRDPVTGVLTQLPGTDGCISDDGSAGDCVNGYGLLGVNSLALSPDGKNLYAVALDSDAVTVFSINSTTGVLTQLGGTDGCASNTAQAGCVDVQGMLDANGVAVSSDGENVYVAADGVSSSGVQGGFVAEFSRNATTGALTHIGCLSENGLDGCTDAKGIDGAAYLAVRPDGKFVYVTGLFTDGTDSIAEGGSVAAFARDATTGVLTQLADPNECIAQTGADGCQDGKGLSYNHSIAISPDGKNVYTDAAFSSAVAVFSSDPVTGALTQLADPHGCVSETGADGCTDGKGLGSTLSAAISPDGATVYVTAYSTASVAVLSRDPATGALTQLPDKEGCITWGGSSQCAEGRMLGTPNGLDFSPDGKNVYVAAAGSNAIAVFGRETGAAATPTPTPTPTPTATAAPTATPAGQSPTPTPTPKPGTAPSGTQAPQSKAEVLKQALAGLPSTKKCISRRNFRIRLRNPKRTKIIAASVVVNGKKAATRKGKRVTAPVDLRGLPKGRIVVKIALVLDDARVVRGKRVYHTCSPRRKGGKPRV